MQTPARIRLNQPRLPSVGTLLPHLPEPPRWRPLAQPPGPATPLSPRALPVPPAQPTLLRTVRTPTIRSPCSRTSLRPRRRHMRSPRPSSNLPSSPPSSPGQALPSVASPSRPYLPPAPAPPPSLDGAILDPRSVVTMGPAAFGHPDQDAATIPTDSLAPAALLEVPLSNAVMPRLDDSIQLSTASLGGSSSAAWSPNLPSARPGMPWAYIMEAPWPRHPNRPRWPSYCRLAYGRCCADAPPAHVATAKQRARNNFPIR